MTVEKSHQNAVLISPSQNQKTHGVDTTPNASKMAKHKLLDVDSEGAVSDNKS